MNRLQIFMLLTVVAALAVGPARAQMQTFTLKPADQQKLGVEVTPLAATTMKASSPA
jgi:hypothetical protein